MTTTGDGKVAQHQDSLHRLIVNRENSDYGKDVTDLRERVEEIIEELMMEYEGMFLSTYPLNVSNTTITLRSADILLGK